MTDRIELPSLIQKGDKKAENYILPDKLKAAVEVSLALGQPLLLTGEPGTGKTRLAYKIAHDLAQDPGSNFASKPLVFHTKTSSIYTDLLYQYDAIGHFQAANMQKETGSSIDIKQFIRLNALGRAIALTNPSNAEDLFVGEDLPKAQSSLVLIDEIDKAPLDFSNDLLNEIESYSFRIKEDNHREIKKSDQHRIALILTSNSEKTLPDAFLRRCVFFHIRFPEGEDMLKIVQQQIGADSQYSQIEFVEHFEKIRDAVRKKRPATAEFLAWLRILEVNKFAENGKVNFDELSPNQLQTLRISYSVLAKTREDLAALEEKFLK